MRRDYYLHQRKNGIFYVEFINPENGKKLAARSTGEMELKKAELKAELWLINGIPANNLQEGRSVVETAGIETIIKSIRKADLNSDDALKIVKTLKELELIEISAVKNTGRGAVRFVDFLNDFWDFDKSDYIQDKIAHGFGYTRRYAHECQKHIRTEIIPFFGDKKLNCVTKDDLEALTIKLKKRGLAISTISQILILCQTPLRWCYKKDIIPVDPSKDLTKFKITNKGRGVLTKQEARTLLYTNKDLWNDKRAYVASLVASSTGARQGEILALRRSAICENTLNIDFSYTPLDGVKNGTKNGEKRNVPLLPVVKNALLDLLKDNPHGGDDPFIFYSLYPTQPVDCKVLLLGLQETLVKIGIDYRARNISFHSWRHFFCSNLTQIISGEKVAKVSGHLTKAVFDEYAKHIEAENINEVGNAVASIFNDILPDNVIHFRKAV